MKSQERHKLKENEFARTVVHAREVLATRQRDVMWAVAVIVALLAIVGGYAWWRQSTASRGTDLLASALAVYEAPVVPVAAPAPGSPAPVQQPGTYPYRAGQARSGASQVPGGRRPLPVDSGRHRRQVSRRRDPRDARALQRGGTAISGSRVESRIQPVWTHRPPRARPGAGRPEEVRQCDHALHRVEPGHELAAARRRRADAARASVRARRAKGRGGPRVHARHRGVPGVALLHGCEARARRRQKVVALSYQLSAVSYQLLARNRLEAPGSELKADG